ncbi:MAG: cysteine desulfurase [Balneolaceae bacterium]|nr:MAG: cysteine desulfurase [Balneolaceae bacterium]
MIQTREAEKNTALLNVDQIREDFPVLGRMINGMPLAYLDNAASSQSPRQVIDAVKLYHESHHSNVHRGVHTLSQEATSLYEEAREKIRAFLNAASLKEIIFTSGTTDAVNLVASSFVEERLNEGDEILITHLEHHSNIVPWHILCERKKAKLRVLPINDRGEIILDNLDDYLTSRTRIVGVNHISNALGTINPVKKIVEAAHRKNIPVLVDGAQATPHEIVDVQDLGCDFYAISGHKMYGPTGIGVLYGKQELLEKMRPYRSGGDMILSVSFDKVVYNELPYRFEAGTPPIAQAIGLGAAADYINSIGKKAIQNYENMLLDYATRKLGEIPQVRFIGTAREKASLVSFVIDGVHPHDVGTILDGEGIAVRTGHHCAQPVMDRFSIPATTRASFAFYNTTEEIDRLVAGVRKVIEVFDA